MRKNTPPPAERALLTPDSPWWGEHRSRYRFAAEQVRGCSVLDIACGSGFGVEMLRNAGASFVAGVDITSEALATRSRPGETAFCVGDGTKLPFRNEIFDVITSFETIEHIDADRSFLAELRRVIRSDGFLFLSTPNAKRPPTADGRPANPYHVREYEPDQLRTLLSEFFARTRLLGQRTGAHYPVSPFWDDPTVVPKDLATRARTLIWKVQNRLPWKIKDTISRALHHRPFYPGEHDFSFTETEIERGHVTVAVCRPEVQT